MYDFTDTVPMGTRAVMAKGVHRVGIKKAEQAPNSANTGENLILSFVGLDGEEKGKEFREWLVLEHVNADAVEIGRRKVRAVLDAVGFTGDESGRLVIPTAPDGGSDWASVLERKVLYVEIDHDEYKGQPTEDVVGYYDETEGKAKQQAKAMTAARLDSFREPAREAAPPPVDGDDLPW